MEEEGRSTERPLRQMDDGFPSSSISFFTFVCFDPKQGDRFLRVLGAEGRRTDRTDGWWSMAVWQKAEAVWQIDVWSLVNGDPHTGKSRSRSRSSAKAGTD